MADYSFVAYYPKLGILILANEADGDDPIDLNNSTNEYVGNPEYYATSPDRKLRINGFSPGGAYDGAFYFLEKWNSSNKKYEFVCYFEDAGRYPSYFRGMNRWSWIDNNKLLIRTYDGCFELEIETSELPQEK